MSVTIRCGQCGFEGPESSFDWQKLHDRFERERGFRVRCRKCDAFFLKAPKRCEYCNQFTGSCRPSCPKVQLRKRYSFESNYQKETVIR